MDDAAAATSALKRARTLHPRRIDLSLDRISRLLDCLGNPQEKLPPVIHVAGTNGKGSTIAILRAILEAAGYRTHAYTSPHLVQFRERIRIGGKLIPDKILTDVLETCEAANQGEEITFFEFTTVAAFLAFSQNKADACLIETGLGGQFDATNVIDNPLITVISPIHLDHFEFLGNTLEQIANEKAGIIKEGVPVILGPQPDNALKVIKRVAKAKSAPLHLCNRDWQSRQSARGPNLMDYRDAKGRLELPKPALVGAHQMMNAGLAIATLRATEKYDLPAAAIRAGLDWVRWPARLQRLDHPEILAGLPKGTEIWLDGGHNIMAARALRNWIKGRMGDERPLELIAGMMKNKDSQAFFSAFSALVTKVRTVSIPGSDGACSAAELAAEVSEVGLQGRPFSNVWSALKDIGVSARSDLPPVILITGSLYLAGEVLKRVQPELQ